MPADLLQTLRIFWQLGDWQALEEFSIQEIETEETKAECAMYIAAACFQLGLIEKGKTFQTLALEWGVNKGEFAEVLLSGVYNALGTASLSANQDASKILQHFLTAAEIAIPTTGINSIIKTRIQNQLSDSPHEIDTSKAIANLVSQKNNLDNSTTPALQTIRQHYLFDEINKVWRRNTDHEFSYSDGKEVEQRILSAIKNCRDVSVYSQELISHQIDWPSEYHLSADRSNLLRPFAAQLRNKSILELGCGCGAITRFLGESDAQVVALEGSPTRATIAAERCRDLKNVSVIVDKLQNAPFSQQFDVVTLIGVLEYARVYLDEPDPIDFVLKKARSYLKPDGVLIVAIENQLGLKYFAGAPEDHGVGVMGGINDLYNRKSPVTFGKRELQRHFIKAGFLNSDTYLTFPDYKLPCLIVHPAAHKHQDSFDLGNILSSTVSYDRQGIPKPAFSLEASWPLISRNGLTEELANSFLFIVHNYAKTWEPSQNVLASYYSPKRGENTSQEITFTKEGSDVLVRRHKANSDTTTEKYLSGPLHSHLLHKILQQPGWTLVQVEEWLQQWLDALELALIEPIAVDGWPDYDKWLPSNYLDAIPRNLIINSDGFSQFIDLEWTLDHGIPLPLILYRGLLITLSTVTSIAPPADANMAQGQPLLEALMRYCGYQLTDSDYKVFVPVLDSLSRTAQGLPSQAVSRVTPIKLTAFNVRQTHSSSQTTLNCMTLYWQHAGDSFGETQAIKHQYVATGDKQEFQLDIPAQKIEYSRFRFDIGEKPGCYQLYALKFYDRYSKLVWEWDFELNNLSNMSDLIIYRATDENLGVCMVCNGYDPQFEINLPDTALITLSKGGTLKLDLCCYN